MLPLPPNAAIAQFQYLAATIHSIVHNPSLTWEERYDQIFSDNISMRLWKLPVRLDYYDPDTSYKEDVMALANAVFQKADELVEGYPQESYYWIIQKRYGKALQQAVFSFVRDVRDTNAE